MKIFEQKGFYEGKENWKHKNVENVPLHASTVKAAATLCLKKALRVTSDVGRKDCQIGRLWFKRSVKTANMLGRK